METNKIARDLYYSADSGHIRDSVVRFFMKGENFNMHYYEYIFGRDFSPTYTKIKTILKSILTLDFLFENYINDDIHQINQWLCCLRAEPYYKESFIRLNDVLKIRGEVQRYLVKNGYHPYKVKVKFSQYSRWFGDPFRIKRESSRLIPAILSEREMYQAGYDTVCICNTPAYTKRKCKDEYKVHSVKFYKDYTYGEYSKVFYDRYMSLCEYFQVKPIMKLNH